MPPAPSGIDLHLHTTRSDGKVDPAELVRQAAALGVRTLALTDHDTLAGYRALGEDPEIEALRAAGLTILPGVEINSIAVGIEGLRENELHVLGLGVDPDNAEFEALMAEQRTGRAIRFERVLARFRELGVGVDEILAANPEAGLDVREGDSLGRPRLARLLVAAGHADSTDDAMERYLLHGGPAWIARDGIGPVEAIVAIRRAGGLPVLAHFADAPTRLGLLRELIDVGLGGLEVYYRRFGVETVTALEATAANLGLTATGGSDFHGDDGETYPEVHAKLWVPPVVLESLHGALDRAASLS